MRPIHCLGILSDSHGRHAVTQRAARMLRDAGAELLIHLGDIGTESVLDAMILGLDAEGRPDPPIRFVFGNCDLDAANLGRYAQHMRLTNDHPMGRMEVSGRTILFTHGDRLHAQHAAIAAADADYLLHGHTHQVRDDRMGKLRILNPGALHRAAAYTAMLLRPDRDEVRWMTIDRNESV